MGYQLHATPRLVVSNNLALRSPSPGVHQWQIGGVSNVREVGVLVAWLYGTSRLSTCFKLLDIELTSGQYVAGPFFRTKDNACTYAISDNLRCSSMTANPSLS
ncbi:hypothetical protein TWF569_003778 [Orbilia oligospora]|uniref:Uncharacterized protein n=1 Tax=Orbilia oligospora TaxID=2813651 RepID=A0A7C8J2J8_ORBOL|nr:hypothetical protein TWF102_011754 [Orbilia oligospora]KAF3104571.1 hypothetical protein TWF103_006893 [Orbilia oligospora]KAF3116425.1 hypothetical protein TWF706_004063 [Orbilia oligospora]KAF3128771.1 hypothetical protein TWF594_011443 [Orbilia oligospora]KAF3151650.1 hypothetical protein TWF569_003778 [Orbilia oligospora]